MVIHLSVLQICSGYTDTLSDAILAVWIIDERTSAKQ